MGARFGELGYHGMLYLLGKACGDKRLPARIRPVLRHSQPDAVRSGRERDRRDTTTPTMTFRATGQAIQFGMTATRLIPILTIMGAGHPSRAATNHPLISSSVAHQPEPHTTP